VNLTGPLCSRSSHTDITIHQAKYEQVGWRCLVIVNPKAIAKNLRRLAYNPYGWLAGLSSGLELLMAYGG